MDDWNGKSENEWLFDVFDDDYLKSGGTFDWNGPWEKPISPQSQLVIHLFIKATREVYQTDHWEGVLRE